MQKNPVGSRLSAGVGAPALGEAMALRFDPDELRGGAAKDRDTIGVV
jgi:hypothetical protein